MCLNQSTRKKWLLVEIKAIGLDTKLNTERKKNSIKLFRLKKKKRMNPVSGTPSLKSQRDIPGEPPRRRHPASRPDPKLGRKAHGFGNWPQIRKLCHGDKS